ncbi:TetR/AcrR family transcriptional regulator [Yinghuangia soli]|uniref:TetR family transcriptional regulator n=1 Tax=Yinghuangia soli TaxID=2908204 RepID=A0AA41Q8P1_9ACTN|nr:TetR/AcrR family transcriptional regulator [Yinghuangia soli]MCF2532404.1 TetR family transcriptional regulator [Yinghuangia soli]
MPDAVLQGRHAVLADAAIELVARDGIRALTHGGLDRAAGLPAGTTSAYFRTRKALVTGLVQRLADLDRIDLEQRGLAGLEAPGPDAPADAAELDFIAEMTAAFVDQWLVAGRNRALARYACLTETSRYPELRALLEPHEAAARAQARDLLARAGAPHPERRAGEYVACVDGLVFDRLIGAGAATAPAPGTPENRAELSSVLRRLLHAAVAE